MVPFRTAALVPLLCLVAQLTVARQAETPGDTVASALASLTWYDLLHRSSSVESFDISAADYRIVLATPLAGGTLSGELRRTTLDFGSNGTKTPLETSFKGKIQSVAVVYRATLGTIGVEGLGRLVEEHGRISFYGGAGATLHFPLTVLEELRLRVSEESEPFDLRVGYLDSELPLSQSLRQTVIESAVALAPLSDNRILIQYKFSGSAPASERGTFLARDNSEMQTWGGTILQRFRGADVSVSYEHISARSTTDFFHNGTTFGEFEFSGATSREVTLECIFPPAPREPGTAVSAGYRILEGTLVGELQSWPFFSVLQSAITNRIYFRMGGRAEYWHAGAGHTFSFSSVSVRPSLTYYDVKPDVGIQTWQPLFLTFGVSSYADNRLDVIRAGVAQLDLAVSMKLQGATISFYGTQFLPVYQKRHAIQGGTGGEPPSPGAPSAKTTGGRWMTLTLQTPL